MVMDARNQPIVLTDKLYRQLHEFAMREHLSLDEAFARAVGAGLLALESQLDAARDLSRYTADARTVLDVAREETAQFNHGYIGTEHLLLAILRQRDTVSADVLRALGVDYDRSREWIRLNIARGTGPAPPLPELRYVSRARKVVRLFAVWEADTLGDDQIGVEHLLLGLVYEGEGMAAWMLLLFGVLSAVRPAVLERIAPASA